MVFLEGIGLRASSSHNRRGGVRYDLGQHERDDTCGYLAGWSNRSIWLRMGRPTMSRTEVATIVAVPEDVDGTIEQMIEQGWRLQRLEKHGKSPETVHHVSMVFARREAGDE